MPISSLIILGILLVPISSGLEYCRKYRSLHGQKWSPSKELINGVKTLMSADMKRRTTFPFELAVYTLTSDQRDDVCGESRSQVDLVNASDVSNHHRLVKRQPDNVRDKTIRMASFLLDFVDRFSINKLVFLINESNRKDVKPIVRRLSKRGVFVASPIARETTDLRLKNSPKTACLIFSDIGDSVELINKNINDVTWLAMSQNPKDDLKTVNLRLDSRFYTMSEAGEVILVREAYRIQNHDPMIQSPIGVWSPMSGLLMSTSNFWERRGNLYGIRLTASTVGDAPFMYASYSEPGGSLEVGGFVYDIWRQYELAANFSTKFVMSVDSKWGSDIGNGSFNGMLGMVQRNEVDASVSSFSLDPPRGKAFDFVMPYDTYKEGFFYKDQTNRNIEWGMYIKPFGFSIWISILVTSAVCIAMLAMTGIKEKQHYFNLEISWLIMLHGIFNQGAPTEPSKNSSRIVFLTCFLFGLVICQCFSAILTSYLTVIQKAAPFRNLEEMITKTNFKIVSMAGSNFVSYFREGNAIQQEVYRSRLEWENTYDEMLTKVKTMPNKAILWTKATLDLAFKDNCNYKEVPDFNMASPFTIFFAKKSPYTKLFNYMLSKLQESGTLNKLKTMWFRDSVTKQCDVLELEPLTMYKVESIFILLGIAIPLSLLLLGCERYLSSKNNQKKFN